MQQLISVWLELGSAFTEIVIKAISRRFSNVLLAIFIENFVLRFIFILHSSVTNWHIALFQSACLEKTPALEISSLVYVKESLKKISTFEMNCTIVF